MLFFWISICCLLFVFFLQISILNCSMLRSSLRLNHPKNVFQVFWNRNCILRLKARSSWLIEAFRFISLTGFRFGAEMHLFHSPLTAFSNWIHVFLLQISFNLTKKLSSRDFFMIHVSFSVVMMVIFSASILWRWFTSLDVISQVWSLTISKKIWPEYRAFIFFNVLTSQVNI